MVTSLCETGVHGQLSQVLDFRVSHQTDTKASADTWVSSEGSAEEGPASKSQCVLAVFSVLKVGRLKGHLTSLPPSGPGFLQDLRPPSVLDLNLSHMQAYCVKASKGESLLVRLT